jgi:inosose dehydratase
VYFGQDEYPDPGLYLAATVDTHFSGVDLGPDGFLGSAPEVAEHLRSAGVGLAGAYLTFGELGERGSHVERDRIERTLETFDAATAAAPELPRPVLTLADGADSAAHYPLWRRGVYGSALAYDEVAALHERVKTISTLFREHGYCTAVHPHLGTILETWAVAAPVVAHTGAGFCLDTGHAWLAGEDPIQLIREARPVLVHLKDADRLAWQQGIAADPDQTYPWRTAGFCALGEGDLDVAAILRELEKVGYSGWIVVEQDLPVGGAGSWADMVAEQRTNAEYLTALCGLR